MLLQRDPGGPLVLGTAQTLGEYMEKRQQEGEEQEEDEEEVVVQEGTLPPTQSMLLPYDSTVDSWRRISRVSTPSYVVCRPIT